MDWYFALELVLKLLIAVILGSMIGVEREWSKHPAGLRTHVLVALGSTTFMLLGLYANKYVDAGTNVVEPTRMAAGIVTGIGFLGAGAILKEGVNVRGLTTAASIWVVASVGLCVATELYVAAFATTILTLTILLLLSRFEFKIGTKEAEGTLVIEGVGQKGLINKVNKVLDGRAEIESSVIDRSEGVIRIKYQLNLSKKGIQNDIVEDLLEFKNIEKVKWLD